MVCEWGEGRGRGGPEPCEPDASSGELRGSEALLCAPFPRAAAAAGAGTHGSGLRGAGEAGPRPRTRGPRSFGRSVTGFPKRTRCALGSEAPIGLRARISRLAETWGRAFGAEEGAGSGEGGEVGGGGERRLEARRRSSTAKAASSAGRRRRRALACRGLDLVWGARAFLCAVVSQETWANFEG